MQYASKNVALLAGCRALLFTDKVAPVSLAASVRLALQRRMAVPA